MKEAQDILPGVLDESGGYHRTWIGGMWIAVDVLTQELMMAPELPLCIQPAPCIVEINILTRIQSGILRGPQLIQPVSGRIRWIGTQEVVKIKIGFGRELLLHLGWRQFVQMHLDFTLLFRTYGETPFLVPE